MNRNILISIASLVFISCGETKNESKDTGNTKTDKHVNIPGTRVYIIPPTGFKIASNYFGLEKGDYSNFQVFDLIGGNYYTNATTFSKEAFEKKGTTVFDYKDTKVNEFPAKYVFMQGDPNEKAISVVFGDSSFSTMIMAIYPSTDDKTGEEIKKAIHTIYYDKNLKIDPFSTIAYTLDEGKSIFKFARSASGIFMYSISGVNKKSFGDEPFITISTLPIEPATTAQSVSEKLLSKIEQYGMTDKELKNISTTTINGYPAYEVEVYGKIQGKSSLIYQLVVTGIDKAVAIQGIVKSDFENNLKEIKNLAKTIKLK